MLFGQVGSPDGLMLDTWPVGGQHWGTGRAAGVVPDKTDPWLDTCTIHVVSTTQGRAKTTRLRTRQGEISENSNEAASAAASR